MDLSNCLFRDDIPIDVRKLIEKEISRQKIQETNNQKRFEELEEALDHTSNMIQVSGINMIWKPAKGVCTFEGLPVAMMWIQSTLAGLMAGTQKMVGTKRFSLALQSEGRRSVEADWDVISQFDDFQEGFRAIANIAAVAGWGEWLLLSIDESNRECRFRVRNSWEGRYQKALGVCWGSAMLAGKFSGYCTKLFKTNCWSEQTTFIAKGDKYDEFICKPSKRSVEEEIETLLISNEATKADMAVALKRLHEEVNKRKESEERYRTLITTTSEGIWVSDLNNITILVNPAMEKILGYSKDELIGHSVKEFLSDESHDIFEIETQKRIMRGTPSAVYELTFIKKNGEPVVTRVAATVLLNHLNEPIGSFGVFSDISLQKHLEKEREDLEARRAEFMALASHELRTPLTNISGFFDVLRKRENNITLEEKARCYDIISNNIQRLQGLISSVGELTRIEQGFFQLNIESVNLVNFIIELFHSYNVRLGAQFKYSVPQKETQVKIIIDPQRVSQALDNILQNAINHSAEENRQIVAKCEVLLDTVEITVADNGAGIDPENLERIFEAFVSIPSKYSIQGTGVGLYLAKTIVEAHGGKIRAYSEGKDKGSTLRISLPRNSDFSNFNYDITSP